MSQTIDTLQPGQIARVRQRTYLVEQIVKPKRAADSTLVKLSCVNDDNQGAPLEVLWEKELDPQVLTSEAWESIAAKGFDESKLFAAYLNTLKWNCVTSTDPKLFQSPFRAGIQELLPHLQSRGEEYAADAEGKLAARGIAESNAMREILETQQKHLSETIKRISKLNPDQLRLDFGEEEDEILQLDANKRYCAKRLEELREELKTEPDRIASIYEIQAKRIEPVGLVYLWPVTG